MYDFVTIAIYFYYAYVTLTVIFILLDNKESTSTISWIFVLLYLPVIGLILYFSFGKNTRKLSKREAELQGYTAKKLHKLLAPISKEHKNVLKKLRKHEWKLSQLLSKNSSAYLTVWNDVKILQNGKEKFPALMEDLKKAKKFIHMEYYIWRSDELTEKVKEILINKAKEGVEIRILFDSIGSLFISQKYLRELRNAGVEILACGSMRSGFRLHTINNRNHLKIVIIDNKIGYTGGMNMAKEYLDGGKTDFWRDTQIKITGHGVSLLQAIFVTNWFYTTKKELFDEKYFEIAKETTETPMQITTSGPDWKWASVNQMYFALATSATKKLYLQTPYFIPDQSIQKALETAALSGLDVKIIMDGLPNQKLPYWAAFTYFEDLLKAGVKIYHYKKGFMHAKTMIVDSTICSIGSANMDVRSFDLNYEMNVMLYDKKLTRKLESDFEEDLKHCKLFTLKDYETLGIIAKLRNSIARLFAPLL